MTSPEAPKFVLNAETLQDPYPMFARIREHNPIHALPGGFMLTGYADSVAMLRDPRFGRADAEAKLQKAHGLGEERMYILPVMFADPPAHTRLRGLLTRAFSLRIVEAMIPQIERVTNELLDNVAGKDTFDLIETVAYKLPISTIASLLGMPVADHDRIHALSEAHAAAIASGGLSPETKDIVERGHRLRMEWAEYFRKLAEERRSNPAADLITELVRAHDGTDKLTEYELIATIIGLLFAGHTTTADVIGTGALALLSHRDQWELLVREPQRVDGAVEEMLRWEPPVQVLPRVALSDADVGGVPVPKGASVRVVVGGANRDPAVFADPERFDITRTPNKHISFGNSIHTCMGGTLARAQIKTVVNALRERFPKLALSGERPTFRQNFIFRGLNRLEVSPS